MGKEGSVQIIVNQAMIKARVPKNATEWEMHEALRTVGLENKPLVRLTHGPVRGVGKVRVPATLKNSEDDSLVIVIGIGDVEK